MYLYELKEGETATVINIKTVGSLRRRLFDMGLIEGTKIKCVFKSPFGDPTAFLFRGSLISLRRNDSRNITVKGELP